MKNFIELIAFNVIFIGLITSSLFLENNIEGAFFISCLYLFIVYLKQNKIKQEALF
jgi:hypothetical protein